MLVTTNFDQERGSFNSFGNNLLVFSNVTDSSNAVIKEASYVCGTSGCNLMKLENGTSFDKLSFPFNSLGIQNNKLINTAINTLAYLDYNNLNGDINTYQCQFSNLGVVSNCVVVGSTISPVEFNNYSSNVPYFIKVNNSYFSINVVLAFNYDSFKTSYYDYSKLTLDGNSWNSISPNYLNIISNAQMIRMNSLCVFGTNNQLLMNADYGDGIRAKYFLSGNNAWNEMSVPISINSDIDQLHDNLVIQGNNMSQNLKGFTGEVRENGNNLINLYYAPYPITCSQTFN